MIEINDGQVFVGLSNHDVLVILNFLVVIVGVTFEVIVSKLEKPWRFGVTKAVHDRELVIRIIPELE